MFFKRIKYLFILCFFASSTLYAHGDQENVAYSDTHVRFTVISSGVLRLEYAPDGKFVDAKSHLAVNRQYPRVDYHLTIKGEWMEITTSKMQMRYRKGSGAFTDTNLEIHSVKGMLPFIWQPGTLQKNNLKGTYRTLDGMDGDIQSQTWVSDTRKGEKLQLEDGILSSDGWTFLDDSRGFLFDDDPEWEWVLERPDNGGQDWYFMAYGHDYKSALKDYTLFAGKMPLPPRYAFGYWWSRYWLYSDKEFRQLIDHFHAYRIPLDVLVVDMDWHYTEKGKGGWTGWTWNRDLFPDPSGFLHYLKQNDLKVTLNLHPADGVASYEEGYQGVVGDLGLDSLNGQTIPWVNSDKKLINSVFRNILSPMERNGVDFWWLDWQQGIYDSKINGLSNTWWINYSFFSYMGKNRDTRPMLYHRWGGLGNHRYQIGFSGDAVISWKSLNYQPYFNATASNVLYGYWSHDLGGHIGNRIDQEMYTRWLQFGALSPIMRTHSQKSANLNKEPWAFEGKYGDVLRHTIRQRYEMAPYIYTMARKGYDEGLSLCRPLYYDYPDREEAYSFRNEYMFGDDILVAPVTAPGVKGYAEVSLWLPEGDWYEWHTGTLLSGNQIVKRSFAIDEYPIYVRAGAVLPFYTGDVMNLNGNDETIVVSVFPGGTGESSFMLYEDNGNDKNYAREYARTKLSSFICGKERTVIIGKREGAYKGMPSCRSFKVKLYSSLVPQSVTINGQAAEYEYLGDEFTVLISLPASSCDQEKEIKIVYSSDNVDLNGLVGMSKRISESMEALKYRVSDICFREEFGRMGSLNEAVMYAPDKLLSLVSTFRKSYARLPEVLKQQGMSDELSELFLQSVHWTEESF